MWPMYVLTPESSSGDVDNDWMILLFPGRFEIASNSKEVKSRECYMDVQEKSVNVQ
jgi:hypothetical protein